jgi:hypothetical protein
MARHESPGASAVAEDKKGKIQPVKIGGLEVQVRYPIGIADIEYVPIAPDGSLAPPRRTLRAILSADEARSLAKLLDKLATSLEQIGGSKQ